MQVIANHTCLRLEEVCHKGMTGIWTKILNDSISKKISLVGYDNAPLALRKLYSNNNNQTFVAYQETKNDFDTKIELESQEEEDQDANEHTETSKYYEQTENEYYNNTHSMRHHQQEKLYTSYQKYKGGIVLEPLRGLHFDVYLFDVTSLYPTMITKYNLSPETVNCSCCKNDPKAGVRQETLKDCSYIPSKNGGRYWICQRRTGLFAKILQELTEQRIKYKNSGLEVESQAIKAIINSGYGVFGHPHFKYYDPRVAELVTACGRDTLTKMQAIANELGFSTLYGDTDSLFVNSVNDVKTFIACK